MAMGFCRVIQKTPERVARFFVNELFYGLNYNNFPKITFNHNQYGYQEPVISKNISFKSTCEHHLVTISGEAFIAYIPKDNVIGLSKINRVVNFFARRPQVQERLTTQIADALVEILKPMGVIVIIDCEHLCMSMRGVRKSEARTVTSAVRGILRDAATRAEAISLITNR